MREIVYDVEKLTVETCVTNAVERLKGMEKVWPCDIELVTWYVGEAQAWATLAVALRSEDRTPKVSGSVG